MSGNRHKPSGGEPSFPGSEDKFLDHMGWMCGHSQLAIRKPHCSNRLIIGKMQFCKIRCRAPLAKMQTAGNFRMTGIGNQCSETSNLNPYES